MKKFSFSLARVLDWKRAQSRVEQAKLERLQGGLSALTGRIAAIGEEQARSERRLLSEGSISGADLAALDAFKNAAAAECARLEQDCRGLRKGIQAQTQIALQKQRDVRLLEKLEQRRLAGWKSALSKETAAEAEELHLARFGRKQIRRPEQME